PRRRSTTSHPDLRLGCRLRRPGPSGGATHWPGGGPGHSASSRLRGPVDYRGVSGGEELTPDYSVQTVDKEVPADVEVHLGPSNRYRSHSSSKRRDSIPCSSERGSRSASTW